MRGGAAPSVVNNLFRRIDYAKKIGHARVMSSLLKEKEDLQDHLEELVARSERRINSLEADLRQSESKLKHQQ